MANYQKILKSTATYGTNKPYVKSQAASSASPLTTKGDVFTFSTSGARLGVGTNGQVLQADSTETTGLKWVTSTSSNYYVDAVSFNSNNGILTLGRVTLADLSTQVSPLTTKGDIWVFGASANVRLPVGTNSYALVADSSTATGLNWAPNSDANYYTSSAAINSNIITGTVAGGGSNWSVDISGLTSVGTIATGVWSGTSIVDGKIASASNWNDAYNNYVASAAYSAGTLTFTQRDGGTFTATGFSQATGSVTGGGADNRIAHWTSATNVTGTSDLTYDGSKLILGSQGKVIVKYNDEDPKESTEILHVVTSGAEASFAIEALDNSSGVKNLGLISTLNANIKNVGQYWNTSGSPSYSDIYEWGYNGDASSANRNLYFKTVLAYPILFSTSNTERMRITSAGNVGIGTTAPAQSLDVRGTTLLSGATDTVPFEVFAYGAGTSALHVTSGSNTGIGTATPLAKLHINASAYQQVFQRDTHHMTIVKGNSDDRLIFATGAPGSHTTRFTINNTGIDVVNDAVVTGTATLGGMAMGGNTVDDILLAADSVSTADDELVSAGYINARYAPVAITGTIGGSITDNQVAIGASTANSIEGSANLTYDGTKLTIARTADATSRGISILDNEGTETISLVTSSGDQGLLYLRGATGGNAIYLDGNGASYMNGGYIGFGTAAPDNQAEVTIVGKVYQQVDANGNVNYGTSSFAHNSGMGNYTGYYSTAIGVQAASYISGNAHRNVAVGYRAMYGASTGQQSSDNTAIGSSALLDLGAGNFNTAVGSSAGENITGGEHNVNIGYLSGRLTTIGHKNIAIGTESLYDNVHGDFNIGIGSGSLYNTTPADGEGKNIAIGTNAGAQNTTGTGNIFIGDQAGNDTTWQTLDDKLVIANTNTTSPLIYGDFSSGGTLTFTASGNAPYSTVFKHSQVSTNGEDGIAIDAREPRLSFINRRDTDETWKIMANNGNSSLQIVKDSQLVKAIFSPDDGGGVTFGIAAAAATSGVAIAQGASYSLDNTTVNRIYRTSSDVSYMSNELHYFNNPVKVAGNIATASLGQALEFADRDDLLIRGTASYDMEITAPQDVAFGIDSDNNETTHAFLWKKDTKTPSSAGTELMRLNEAGNLGIGTTAPSYPLHVVQASGDTYGMYLFNSASRGIYFGDTSNNGTGYGKIGGVGGSLFLGSTQIYTSLIGTGDANTTLGSQSRRWSYFFTRYGQVGYDTSTTSTAQFGISGASDKVPLEVYAYGATTPALHITSGSDIGIGTTSPSEHLHVESAGNTQALFKSTDNRGLIQVADDDTTASIVAESSTLSLGLTSQMATTNINIDTDGKLGIGITDPVRHLDVNSGGTDNVVRFTSTDNRANIQLSDDDTNRYIVTENSAISLGSNSALHVDNLNYVGTNLGIGTTAPASKLHVAPSGSIANGISVGAAGNHGMYAYNATQLRFAVAGVDKLRVTAEGCQFGSDGSWSPRTLVGTGTANAPSASNIAFRPLADDTDTGYSRSADNTLALVAGGTQVITATSTNVGIGTTSPNVELHVNGDARIEAGHKLYFDDTGTGEYIYATGNDLRLHASDHLVLDAEDQVTVRASDFAWETDGASEKMRFKADTGRLGIGTNAPDKKLDVRGDSSTWPIAALSGANTHGTGLQLYNSHTTQQDWAIIGGGASHNYSFRIYDQTDAMYRFAVDRDGGVGIGGTNAQIVSPSDRLTVIGESNASVQLGMYAHSATDDKTAKIFLNKSANSTVGSHSAVADNDVLGLIGFRGSDGDSYELGAQIRGQATQDFAAGARGTDLIFSTVDNSTTTLDDKMVLTQAGNVGIGTTAPSNPLHIAGHVNPLRLQGTSTGKVELGVSTSGDFTIDADDDIRLDSGGQDIVLYGQGSQFARLTNASTDFEILTTTQDRDLIFKGNDGGSTIEAMRIDYSAGGNVGIGTTSPLAAAKLTLSDSTNTYLNFKPQATHNNWTIGADASGFIFYDETVGGYRMNITDAGNVGIGTTAPGQMLDVAGNIRATGSSGIKSMVKSSLGYIQMEVTDATYLKADHHLYMWTRGTGQPTTVRAEDGAVNIQAHDNLVLKAGDSTAMTIDTSQNAVFAGTISATAKSFNIPHPLYNDKRLVHGSLEGPEHGLYTRGTIEASNGGLIELPEYWSAMCKDYTVQLTPHGPYTVFIEEKQMDKIMVGCTVKDFKFDYYIVGARTDETLEVVQDG